MKNRIFVVISLFVMYGSIVLAARAFRSETTRTIPASRLVNSNGPSAGKTGAPGEATCTQCHGGTAQSGAAVNALIFSGAANEYQPGNTYTFSISMSTGTIKNGFQVTALDASNTMAGSWVITDALRTKIVSGGGRSYVTHTGSGNTQSSWSMDWTAPASDVGDVTFYAATNASNNNGQDSGDQIYLSQLTIGSATGTGISQYQMMQDALEIYPLGEGRFQIGFQSFESANVMIKAYTVDGRLLYTHDLGQLPGGDHTHQLLIGTSEQIVLFNVFINNHVLFHKAASF